ncbi:MAG: hypothetical protein Q8L35_08675 [Actinomycetota bacterium]|nr:hypothetical protein [Actinomycetota bacterium]
MGLGMAAVKLNLELWQRGLFKDLNSVLDFGSQELHLKLADFEEFVDAAGIVDYDKSKFAALDNWPGAPRCSAKPFYSLMGLNKYASVDLGGEFGSIPIDLGEPLSNPEQYGQFDVVTDHGTNEHVFNVPEAYRTMHRLCKKNGMMVICQAAYNGNGYYNFDSSFFEGLAAANNYRILFASYTITTKDLTPEGSNVQFDVPLARDLLNAIDLSKITHLGICYVFSKMADADFQYPYQGGYLSQKQGHFGYELKFSAEPPSRSYLPVFDSNDIPVTTKELAKVLYRRVAAKIFRS